MERIKNLEKLNELIDTKNSFFIYKHSSTCSISANAKKEVLEFEKAHPSIKIYEILVIEERPISNKVQEVLEIKHASPQLLLIKDKKCLWNTSHYKIKNETIKKILVKLD